MWVAAWSMLQCQKSAIPLPGRNLAHPEQLESLLQESCIRSCWRNHSIIIFNHVIAWVWEVGHIHGTVQESKEWFRWLLCHGCFGGCNVGMGVAKLLTHACDVVAQCHMMERYVHQLSCAHESHFKRLRLGASKSESLCGPNNSRTRQQPTHLWMCLRPSKYFKAPKHIRRMVLNGTQVQDLGQKRQKQRKENKNKPPPPGFHAWPGYRRNKPMGSAFWVAKEQSKYQMRMHETYTTVLPLSRLVVVLQYWRIHCSEVSGVSQKYEMCLQKSDNAFSTKNSTAL